MQKVSTGGGDDAAPPRAQRPAALSVSPTLAPAPVELASASGPSVEAAPPWRFWESSQSPIVLRLPSGAVWLMALGLVGVILLSYWVGIWRGYRRAERDFHAVGAVTTSQAGHVPSLAAPTVAGTQAGAAPTRTSPTPQPAPGNLPLLLKGTGEPRAVGLNYFVLAHYPQADAERLILFLASQGVEAAAVRGPDQRLFQVIALRGFVREELTSPARQQLEQALRQLGRAWSNQKLGPDFSKSGIYLDLFEGEPIAESITKATQP